MMISNNNNREGTLPKFPPSVANMTGSDTRKAMIWENEEKKEAKEASVSVGHRRGSRDLDFYFFQGELR